MLTAVAAVARGMTTQQQPPPPPAPGPPPHGAGASQQADSALSLRNVVVKGRWKIGDTIGKGAFGDVYAAADLVTGETVAIKVETPACKKPVLKLEISVIRKLQDTPYVCRHIAAGRFTWPSPPPICMISSENPPVIFLDNVYSYMVMELLGPNLSELRRKVPHGKFSLATTGILGKQMLRGIEALHEVGIIHRDIKPGNFCMSLPDLDPSNRAKCYLIDFGLSRRYLSGNGKVREPRSRVGFRGTARYASANAHLGMELGRVDDLWSLFYLLVESLTGSLPWKGKEKERIGELKQKCTAEELCQGLPTSMLAFHDYLITLNYDHRPNYDYIHDLIHELFVVSGKPESIPYDWDLPQNHLSSQNDATVSESADAAAVPAAGTSLYTHGTTSGLRDAQSPDVANADIYGSSPFKSSRASSDGPPSAAGHAIPPSGHRHQYHRAPAAPPLSIPGGYPASAYASTSPPTSAGPFRTQASPGAPEPRRYIGDDGRGRAGGAGSSLLAPRKSFGSAGNIASYGSGTIGAPGGLAADGSMGRKDDDEIVLKDEVDVMLQNPPPLPSRSQNPAGADASQSLDGGNHTSSAVYSPKPPAQPPKPRFRRIYLKYTPPAK